jgi:AcrR family transcriptional regulator
MKKVEHIYREASKLFARYGFEGVTMRDIADACGITMATLYYHFSSKGELHDEITQYRFEEFIGGVIEQQKALPPAQDTPSALLALIFDAVLDDPTLFNLMQHDMHYHDADVRHSRSRKKASAFLTLIGDTVAH